MLAENPFCPGGRWVKDQKMSSKMADEIKDNLGAVQC